MRGTRARPPREGSWTAVAACGLLLASAGACQVDGLDMESGFYDPAASFSTTSPPIPSEDTDAGSSSSGDTDDGSGGSTDPGTDSAATTDDPATTGDTAATSAGSTGGGSEQPEDGMYSECTSVTQCVGLSMCTTTTDGSDGFCTATGCTDPVLDCDPAPGGTAFPECVSMGMGSSSAVCALDCSDDRICPAGMNCVSLPEGTVCI